MSKPIDTDRRNFLRGIAVAGGTTALASAIAVSDSTEASAENGPRQSAAESKGYQLTEHVRAYYRTSRI